MAALSQRVHSTELPVRRFYPANAFYHGILMMSAPTEPPTIDEAK